MTPKKCDAQSVSESRIIPPVWEKLKEILTNPKFIIQQINDYLNQKSKQNQTQKQLSSVKNTLTSFEKKIERYAELYAEGSISKDFYDKKIEACEREAENLKKEKEKLAQLLLTEEEKQRMVKSAEELYNQLKESFESATYEVKREVLQRLVGKIIKTKDELDIEFNLPLEDSSLKSTTSGCGDSRRMDRNI